MDSQDYYQNYHRSKAVNIDGGEGGRIAQAAEQKELDFCERGRYLIDILSILYRSGGTVFPHRIRSCSIHRSEAV